MDCDSYMGILGDTSNMPSDWLPFLKEYGPYAVGLVLSVWLLIQQTKTHTQFLLNLIASLTTRVRDLEGADEESLVDTLNNAANAISEFNRTTETLNDNIKTLVRHQEMEEKILLRCSTQLDESAKLMERLRRSRTFQALPHLPPEDPSNRS